MNIRYRVVNWVVNKEKFAAAITEMRQNFTLKELASLFDVGVSTVNNWSNGNWGSEFPHPNMSNFLTVINALDLDPRDFFVLEDV